eukprot:2901600-Alexandrium_andersonii.AAC.1
MLLLVIYFKDLKVDALSNCEFYSPPRIVKHFKHHKLTTLWNIALRALSVGKGPEERFSALR